MTRNLSDLGQFEFITQWTRQLIADFYHHFLFFYDLPLFERFLKFFSFLHVKIIAFHRFDLTKSKVHTFFKQQPKT